MRTPTSDASNFEPVALQFSLFSSNVTAETYSLFLPVIMEPLLQHILCRNGFYLLRGNSNDNMNETETTDAVSIIPCAVVDADSASAVLSSNDTTTKSLAPHHHDSIFNRSLLPWDDAFEVEFNPATTILRQGPVFVEDRYSNGGTYDTSNNNDLLQWTSWTLFFDLIQLGDSLRDMAYLGSGSEVLDDVDDDMEDLINITNAASSSIISSVEKTNAAGIQIYFDSSNNTDEDIHDNNLQLDDDDDGTINKTTTTNMMHAVVTNVLQLALEVNIMEGTLDDTILRVLPGTRFSCPMEEVATFGSPKETEPRMDLPEPNLTVIPTNADSNNNMPASMSMVAISMYTTQTLRNCGAIMLITTLLLLWSLIHTAKHQRKENKEFHHQEEETIPQEVMFPPVTLRERPRKVQRRPVRMAPVVLLASLLPILAASSGLPPNFVIVLTDDLDWTLGGANASTLSRTHKYIAEEGKTFANWFVQTPVCCPSRAELLTGRMFHNLRVHTNVQAGSCMHVNVTNNRLHPFYSRDYFAPFFSQNKTLMYNVGVFGKHLNGGNPSNFMLPGVDEMLINGGGDYLDPVFTFGSGTDDSVQSIHFNTCQKHTGMPCYATSIIGNASLSWIERQVKEIPRLRPFMALISVKAPHLQDGPGFPLSIPAPWYNDTEIEESMAPRTPNYNNSGSPDHHWLVRSQGPLTKNEERKIDQLYVSRLKTLISVDDLVEDLIMQLTDLKVLNNTYIIFTSDNGYRLGQFRMPMAKLHPYENDIRVPMMIRGPGISKNSTSSLISTHVNLMPTLMGLATKQYNSQDVVPSTMDGTNLAGMILDRNVIKENDPVQVFESSSVLVEYTSLGNVERYHHLVDTYNHSFVAIRIFDTDPAHYPLHNMKYVEFRDTRIDWNMTAAPLERELYDLENDPHELQNLVSEVSPVLVNAMSEKIQKMMQCQGGLCRQEHTSGLEEFWKTRKESRLESLSME